MFRTLGRDLQHIQESYGTLRGQVTVEPAAAGPIVVVLYRGEPGAESVVDAYVQERPGAYFFIAAPGEYRVAAFEDRRGTLSYDHTRDAAAHFGGGQVVTIVAGETTGGLDIFLRPDSEERIAFDFILAPSSAHGRNAALPSARIGEIVTLDDARFSDANAALGLWQPAEFLLDVGAGIYLLEPYDEDKTPVLFIHGALGHPGVWREMVARLDRERFQPWIVYYPTAARLDVVGTALERWVQQLAVTHRFERLFVVAHSMGGLVARDFVGRMVRRGLAGEGGVELLVTMATPWAGQAGAGRGVEQAPVVAPSWYDMAPGSPFLESIWSEPLPSEVPYHLLFTYGGGSALIRGANDGAVTLASELEPRAQEAATQVYGFDVGHGAILRSDAASDRLNRILVAADED